MRRRYKKLGCFELTQPIMRVSDPGYDKDTWCAGTIKNCLTGKWHAAISTKDEGGWGERVSILVARHETAPAFAAANKVYIEEHGDTATVYWPRVGWTRYEGTIGVDSGQCGLFDDAKYQDESLFKKKPKVSFCEGWYGHCCDRTLSEKQAGVIPGGAVSSSGFGDGTYDAFYHTNENGEVDMACILFL